VKLITWNVNKKWRLLEDQIRFIASRSPDIVTLQEVTTRTGPEFFECFSFQTALTHIRLSLPPEGLKTVQKNPLGVLIASRFPLREPQTRIDSPWAEKTLSTLISLPETLLELHTVHVPPGSSNKWVKVEVLEAVFKALAQTAPSPRVLTGDFNTPQAELKDGTVVTWAQRLGSDGRPRDRKSIRGGPASRWDDAERNVLTGLGTWGIKDAFRSVHGYGQDAKSWVYRGRLHRRFDHVLASEELKIQSAEYLVEPVNTGLSDHSPLEVVFETQGLLKNR
jgi:exonuclease III